MAALVIVETIGLAVLALLVAGLLRGYAEVLRLLHHLGVDDFDPDAPVALAPGRGPARAQRGGSEAHDVAGLTPVGDAVVIGVSHPDANVLLVFLSSGCDTCARFWEAMAAGRHLALGTRVIAITRDGDQESIGRLRQWGAEGVEVVLSNRAWDDYRVPGSPYAIFCHGGAIVGEGTATSWEQLESLVDQADLDHEAGRGTARLGRRREPSILRARQELTQRRNTDARREGRADDELAAAGIEPGDPRLYPPLTRESQ
ncbi:MAG: hypothetical protein ABJD24_10940 [Acidimicrobiales bacterium]